MLDRYVLPLTGLTAPDGEALLFAAPVNTDPVPLDDDGLTDAGSPWGLISPAVPDMPPEG